MSDIERQRSGGDLRIPELASLELGAADAQVEGQSDASNSKLQYLAFPKSWLNKVDTDLQDSAAST